jgi:hypothetical protein
MQFTRALYYVLLRTSKYSPLHQFGNTLSLPSENDRQNYGFVHGILMFTFSDSRQRDSVL